MSDSSSTILVIVLASTDKYCLNEYSIRHFKMRVFQYFIYLSYSTGDIFKIDLVSWSHLSFQLPCLLALWGDIALCPTSPRRPLMDNRDCLSPVSLANWLWFNLRASWVREKGSERGKNWRQFFASSNIDFLLSKCVCKDRFASSLFLYSENYFTDFYCEHFQTS